MTSEAVSGPLKCMDGIRGCVWTTGIYGDVRGCVRIPVVYGRGQMLCSDYRGTWMTS